MVGLCDITMILFIAILSLISLICFAHSGDICHKNNNVLKVKAQAQNISPCGAM